MIFWIISSPVHNIRALRKDRRETGCDVIASFRRAPLLWRLRKSRKICSKIGIKKKIALISLKIEFPNQSRKRAIAYVLACLSFRAENFEADFKGVACRIFQPIFCAFSEKSLVVTERFRMLVSNLFMWIITNVFANFYGTHKHPLFA